MATATAGVSVRIDALAHAYAPGTDTLAGIDLTVAAGEFVAFVGASGCGKTTLLRLVAGLISPQQGTVRTGGRPPAELRGESAFVFQEPALLPWRTVAANVGLGLELAGIPARERTPRVADRLALVGLKEAAKLYPHELSGGMRMRTSLARALAGEPRLLLLDEPFGALDEITRQRLGGELLRLRAGGGWTALYVTHSAAEAVFLAQRVVVLGGQPGRIIGTVNVPFGPLRDEETRADTTFADTVRAVTQLLARAAEERV